MNEKRHKAFQSKSKICFPTQPVTSFPAPVSPLPVTEKFKALKATYLQINRSHHHGCHHDDRGTYA